MATKDQLKEEQAHFDRAADAREEVRRTFSGAHGAAAGPRAAASAVRRGADKALAKIGAADEPVAFGRFDAVDGDSLYLGKHVIADTNRDLLVINWQAPAAAPYFQASVDDPCGVIRRRKFSTQRNRVTDFEEIVFAKLAADMQSLTESERTGIDDTVLRDLEQDRTGEMQDIVQTIHASQYQLVRSPLEQLLVVQGGPGTGKTAVALHRVSWLLFNHLGRLNADDVLVIGPNPTFTRYIRSVLPGLGDTDVHHRDLRSLGPQRSTGREEETDVARLKGEERMAELLHTALWQRVRFPAGQNAIPVGPSGRQFVLRKFDVEAQIRRLQQAPTYSAGRLGFRSWLSGQVGETASPSQIDNAVERVWPSLTPQAFLRELFGSRERLVAAAGDEFTAGDVNRLLRPAAQRVSDEQWSDADVALLDEAETLMNGLTHRYSHVVVDEAQDLSPMQLRSTRRRSTNGSMTVVGDLAQSTGPWARDSWEDVVAALKQQSPANVEELTLGYRVPEQVYALAAQLLPEAAPAVSPPRVIRKGPAEPDLVLVDDEDRVSEAVKAAQGYAGRGLFVGIICPHELREELTGALGDADVAWSDASQGNLGKSINVVSPEDAKGLEFDAVVVLEPELLAGQSERGLRLLYVALTRTTRYLSVVHSGRVLPLRQPPVIEERRPPMVDSHDEPPAAVVDVTDEALGGADEPQVDPRHLPEAVPEPAEPSVEGRPSSTAQGLEEPRSTRTPRPAPENERAADAAPPPESDIARLVSAAVAQSLAKSVRDSVAAPLWPYVVDRLRRELGVSDMELFDLFDLND